MTVAATGRLTGKIQATMPLPVRRASKLGKSGAVAFEIRGDVVILRHAAGCSSRDRRALRPTIEALLHG